MKSKKNTKLVSYSLRNLLLLILVPIVFQQKAAFAMGEGSLLHSACEEGNIENARNLALQNKDALRAKDAFGRTPLCIAAAYGHEDLVTFFVAEMHMKGDGQPQHAVLTPAMNVNPQDKRSYNHGKYIAGGSPLHYACQKLGQGNIDNESLRNSKMNIIRLLLKNGYGPWEVTKSCANCLHIACLDQDEAFLTSLIGELNTLKVNFDWLNWQDIDGKTPLHICCAQFRPHGVKALLRYNINTNLQAEYGATPLHEALKVILMDGRSQENELAAFSIVQDLINHRANPANPHIRDYWGTTPAHLACKNGYFKVVQLLIKTQQDARNTGKSILKERISEYLPENMFETTALHHAAAGGHQEIVEYLVEICSADATSQSEVGSTPLHHAIFYHGETDELIQYLAYRMGAAKNCISYCHFLGGAKEWGSPLHLLKEQCPASKLITSLAANGFIDKTPNAFNRISMDIRLRPISYLLPAGTIAIVGLLIWRGIIQPKYVLRFTVEGVVALLSNNKVFRFTNHKD